VLAARGDRARLEHVIASSVLPMLVVDDDRRYLDANASARLAFGLSLAEFRRLRIDDLTSPEHLPSLEKRWAHLLQKGHSSGPWAFTSPAGARLDVRFYALANALPGRHLGGFVFATWPDGELLDRGAETAPAIGAALTARELEVLGLAAEGNTGPMIARELFVSSATVRTHFEHIYRKLGVTDRAAAVAVALRTGLIT
jgi:DNA-binding CsgD family transcriptional regulator